MNTKAIFVPTAMPSNRDTLVIALVVAIIVHLALVLGMTFSTREPERVNKPIDITLINTPAPKAPEKADFLAQENQIGAEARAKKPEPPPQQPASQGDNQIKQAQKTATEASKPKAAQKIMTQKKAEKKLVTANKPEPVHQPENRPQITAESLQQQISQLGAEFRQSPPSGEQSRIIAIDSVNAHQFMAAQYMADWISKVTRIGKLNYPEAAAKKNFSGPLTMAVGINADGSIYSIRINRSSGNPELDEAAKNIVRMSAPFAPLPLELRKELNVLVITRTWLFSDESGLVSP